jgi:hypothetical protein
MEVMTVLRSLVAVTALNQQQQQQQQGRVLRCGSRTWSQRDHSKHGRSPSSQSRRHQSSSSSRRQLLAASLWPAPLSLVLSLLNLLLVLLLLLLLPAMLKLASSPLLRHLEQQQQQLSRSGRKLSHPLIGLQAMTRMRSHPQLLQQRSAALRSGD